nr:DUF4148 domain-containing protein [uncultured Albidiferax sp.]
MNTRKLLATSLIALASVAATSAFADSYDREFPLVTNTPSTVTRAQVQAELVQAEKDGTMAAVNDNNYPVIQNTGPAKTRAEVRAEVAAAAKAGTLDIRGDYHG